MSQKKIFLALGSAAILIGGFWIYRQLAPAATGLAPNFQLSDTAGHVVSLSQFRGHPVLLNFWATWCPACREELPDLESVYKRYASSGFTILGISVDDGGKTAVLPFLAVFPINYPVLFCDPQTADAYHIYELPSSFLIGPDGKIVQRYIGPIDPKSLENDILKLMPAGAKNKT